jgi:hypothetical protein
MSSKFFTCPVIHKLEYMDVKINLDYVLYNIVWGTRKARENLTYQNTY